MADFCHRGSLTVYIDAVINSVNHDVVLHDSLKTKFGIDGRILKFLADYLSDCKRQILISRKLSSLRNAQSFDSGIIWLICQVVLEAL